MKTLILAIALSLSLPAFAHKVIGIADGDTLTLLVDKKPLKVRLANVDAPEKVQDIDRYGRTVAVVTCAGVQVRLHSFGGEYR